ncbi:hypothetical protein [Capnocytophaga sp.]|uniref:hypothetical protein n=1 Tax=Capnocytophaga sp. TaxID=44737 RepID=UPI0026DB705B|nr:hypothetical protein [Capnocytophaga sp.]MDO5105822.1 hypothetical protein [Capnocytophaga sp.]
MRTIKLQNDITPKQYKMVVNLLKAVNIKVKKQKKDDTKMSKEAFFAKIDKARKQEGKTMSIESFEARFLK